MGADQSMLRLSACGLLSAAGKGRGGVDQAALKRACRVKALGRYVWQFNGHVLGFGGLESHQVVCFGE